MPKDTVGYIIAPATDHELLGGLTKDIHQNDALTSPGLAVRV